MPCEGTQCTVPRVRVHRERGEWRGVRREGSILKYLGRDGHILVTVNFNSPLFLHQMLDWLQYYMTKTLAHHSLTSCLIK